jgi:hypothetical protein
MRLQLALLRLWALAHAHVAMAAAQQQHGHVELLWQDMVLTAEDA